MVKRVWQILLSDIHQSFMVVGVCVGIMLGAILAMVFRINYFVSPIWIGLAVVLLMVVYLKPKYVFLVFALIAGMILIFFRTAGELKDEAYVRQFDGLNVVVTGTINGDPESDELITKFKLTKLAFGESGEYEVDSSVYVSVNKNEELARGDRIVLEGKMLDGFGTYAGFLYKPRIKKWERPEPGDLVLRIRNWFAERIKGLIPEPEVSLGLSYLLGMKSGLPDGLNEDLHTVGLVHIVVASGAHLAILVEVARKLFGKISRFAGVLFSVLFVLFFMCMVGWTPSILRAGAMTILTIITWYSGRKIETWRLLLLVAAFTLMIEPTFLVNLGWLLSFASYIGIMVIGPKLIRFFYGTKKPGFLGSVIITTIAATLMTLPITLYYYGAISLISVIANLLILPSLPWAMGLVFLTGVLAGIPGLEIVIAWCAKMMLSYHIMVVEWLGSIKQLLVEIPKYQWWVFLLYFIIMAPLVIGLIRRKVVKCRVS
ncbi:ComEC/Rec2 family competence protein [Candidatus Saccharibacteria bacterium]|nr:ComEC/Rec2 family competence protein [Candidatus Saccharibacteria bacterium]